jgi:CBS domain-containing protein
VEIKMNVAAILKTKGASVFTDLPDTPLSSIVSTLVKKKIGVVVICDEDGTLCGIISERDIVRSLAQDGPAMLENPASSIMTKDVQTCVPADTIATIMRQMSDRKFRHVPVVEDGQLCGIISIGDVVKERLQEIQSEADALRDYVTTA